MSKAFDFDAFWAEAMPTEAERPRVKIFGEEILLPASLPARFMLFTLRKLEAGVDPEATVSVDELLKVASSFYGKERVERWLDQGMTLDQLADVFRHTLALYQPDNGDGEGNATTPKTGAK